MGLEGLKSDFISHSILIDTADGSSKTIALRPRSVADFSQETMSAMAWLGIPVTIWTTPVEVPDRTPFEKDQKHTAYDPEYAQRVLRYFAIGGDNTSTSDPRPPQFCLDFEFVLSLGGDMSEMWRYSLDVMRLGTDKQRNIAYNYLLLRLYMKFGLQHPNYNFDYDGRDASEIIDSLKNLATKAENLGFDSFWVMDHFHQIPSVGKKEDPMLEGWTTISVLAGITSKIKLGTLVTGIIYRHPSVLAKMGASLDVLSKGRLFMGIGAAWNQEESLAYGIPFFPNKERLLRLEEAIQIIRKMWTEEPAATFNGKYYQINNAYCNPKPIQKPSPPIMVGGSGERQTLKIVAKYADACNLFGSAETIKRKLSVLKEHCKSVGRDYDSILKTKLGLIVVDNDNERVEKRVQQISKIMPNEQVGEFLMYGTPEEVLKQIGLLEEVGIQYIIVDLEPYRELEALEIFGNSIIKNKSRTANAT